MQCLVSFSRVERIEMALMLKHQEDFEEGISVFFIHFFFVLKVRPNIQSRSLQVREIGFQPSSATNYHGPGKLLNVPKPRILLVKRKESF